MRRELIEPHLSNYQRLLDHLAGYDRLVVAYSGGVDSALLAFAAHDALGDRMTCAIGISPSLAPREHDDAIAFVREHGIPFKRIETHEMDKLEYRQNNPDRCYFCKDELFAQIRATAAAVPGATIAYGANVDDLGDHRPGARAAREHRVVSPLVEAGFDKPTIRDTAQALGLRVWDKPAAPCLASRIPYYQEVTPEKLEQIARAEAALKDRGFHVCRVRHHGELARIELLPDDRLRLLAGDQWPGIVEQIRATGFQYVVLDLEGFRSGRLNERLTDSEREADPAR